MQNSSYRCQILTQRNVFMMSLDTLFPMILRANSGPEPAYIDPAKLDGDVAMKLDLNRFLNLDVILNHIWMGFWLAIGYKLAIKVLAHIPWL